MTKRELIEDPQSCLNNTGDEEPVFLLRARDVLAPKVVRLWVTLLKMETDEHNEKASQAYTLSNQMLTWQTIYGKKLPD
jgi:hypothetical protein